MLEVLLALFAGIIIGKIGRNSKHLQRGATRLTGWGVLALLFCMGLSVGGNASVMQNLPLLGGQALLLTLGSAGGAFLLCLPLARILQRKPDNISTTSSGEQL